MKISLFKYKTLAWALLLLCTMAQPLFSAEKKVAFLRHKSDRDGMQYKIFDSAAKATQNGEARIDTFVKGENKTFWDGEKWGEEAKNAMAFTRAAMEVFIADQSKSIDALKKIDATAYGKLKSQWNDDDDAITYYNSQKKQFDFMGQDAFFGPKKPDPDDKEPKQHSSDKSGMSFTLIASIAGGALLLIVLASYGLYLSRAQGTSIESKGKGRSDRRLR